jgi:hypothetical protein
MSTSAVSTTILQGLTEEEKNTLYAELISTKNEERKEQIINSLKNAGATVGNIAVEIARYTTKTVASIGNGALTSVYDGIKGIIIGAGQGAKRGWQVWKKQE